MIKYVILWFIAFTLIIGDGFSQVTWIQKASLPALGRRGATGFSIGTKGYIGCGYTISGAINDFWEWDQNANTWTQKATLPIARADASGFSIGTKGYLCCGNSSSSTFYNDLWEWDQSLNSWTQKANMPVSAGLRSTALGFSLGSKGYVGTGISPSFSFLADLWEWDQASNTWIQKATSPAIRGYGAGFSIGNNLYFGTGASGPGIYLNDFWEWNQSSNVWTQKATVPVSNRYEAIGFAIGNKGYIGTGNDGSDNNNFVEWDQTTNTWTSTINLPSNIRSDADRSSFSICNKGYILGGWNGSTYFNDFWEFSNGTSFSGNVFGNTSICLGANTTLTASGGISYSWSTNSTTSSIIVNPTSTTTYSVTISNGTCSFDTSITVNIISTINAAVSGTTTICVGGSTTLTATGGTNYLWSNGAITNSIVVSPSSSTSYSVTVSTGTCLDTSSTFITVNPSPSVNVSPNITILPGNSTTLDASGGGPYSWSTGATSDSISVNPASTTVYYVYSINFFGCMDADTVIVYVLEPDCGNPEKDLFIPNAFSPNNDGENDVLRVSYTKGIDCIKDFYMAIYNRWGQMVYEAQTTSETWDGKYKGNVFDPSVFTYYCKISLYSGKEAIRKGNITLLK